ncbi:ScbR family autoregulator-binding transcription factor [Kitasatospora sp. GP82]|uniref:ScbR family autoregulator-binding transcription factor n=1 Tax=Kitasatospora sp. GP82 TaxID=3035089 RepID=UPI002472F613|nr:ScbR family autoregulator-binding transcription factor [Kitasatospora sp. GP82]MDH6129521.1 AcrR family transcriptional regulator [Kitasatospora sp. GP82]
MTKPPGVDAFVGKVFADRSPDLRQSRAMRTRVHVLRCAAEVFAERGFGASSVKDVADRAQLTKGAVYFHFPSKELLATAVVEALYERWPVMLADVQQEELGPLGTAREMLDRTAVAFRDDPIVQAGARLQIERDLIEAELPPPYSDWTALLTGLLEEARAAGELREGVDPGAAARTLVAGFFGMQHISDNLHRRADIMERWAEVRSLLFFAITG